MKKPPKPPKSEPWEKMAKTTWANAANRRMNKGKAMPAKDGEAVIPSHVKVQKLPGFTEDTRFKADPNAYGCGFSAVGIGRDVETGRAW